MAMGGMDRIEGNKMAEYGKVPYWPGEKKKKNEKKGGMDRIEGNKMAEYGKVPYWPREKNENKMKKKGEWTGLRATKWQNMERCHIDQERKMKIKMMDGGIIRIDANNMAEYGNERLTKT